MSSSTSIDAAFARAREEGRAALMPFVTAGDPSPEKTVEILAALAEGGADLIELGLPFSDPVADGPAIQLSSQRALNAGFETARVFDIVTEFRRLHSVPIILFTYVNPVLAIGVSEFAKAAQSAGADGVILVDLPYEESAEIRRILAEHQLDLVYLVAPTTSRERLANILNAASGFVYYVSMTGVTGSHLTRFQQVLDRVEAIKQATKLPVAVGFGVQTSADVKALAGVVDGVVVGSELVRRIHHAGSAGAAEAASRLTKQLRAATSR